MPFPGPECLGRGIVVSGAQPVPEAFSHAPEVRIDDAVLAQPQAALRTLHSAWALRTRVVVRLEISAAALREPQRSQEAPYALGSSFEFSRERLAFLIWANNYDLTDGSPRWRLAQHAMSRLDARPSSDADVTLADGTAVWCDGGPRGGLPIAVLHGETLALGRLGLTRPADLTAPALDLAEDQRRAVLHPSGAARVIAPAGSGKTRVLTARLRHLLEDRGYEPEGVTAVAYNKRAAVELEERLRGVGARVKTLHALGYEILRRRGGAQLIGEREVRQIVGRLARVEPQRGKDPLAAWLEALAEVRLALRDPREVERRRGDAVKGFAEVFQCYRRMLSDDGLCDYDEQIYGAIEYLLDNVEERRRMQRQCRHLLVDEFQDLTPAYLLLLRLLAAPAWQVFGVGDDDQVIYGYTGATPNFLINFKNYFPAANEYALENNYRCQAEIVEAASRLLTHNRRRIAKTIVAAAPPHDGGLLATTVPASEMASAVLRAVTELFERGHRPEQVAVLCRVNDGLLPVQIVLQQHDIPCTSAIDASLLERSGVRAALSWIAVACGPAVLKSAQAQETLMRPSRKIRRATVDRLSERVAWTDSDLFAFARTLQSWEAELVRAWLQDVQKLRGMASRKATTLDMLRFIREKMGLGTDMQTLDESHGDVAGSSHVDQLLALEQVAPLHTEAASFEAWLRDSLALRGQRGGVTLSTIHKVKGMEWDFVVVYGVTAGLMPHRLAEDVEEERRVFHVAMTRARHAAILLGERERPSPFLAQATAVPRKTSEGPSVRPRKGKKKGGDSSAVESLTAEVGLALQAPHRGTVCALEDYHVVLQLEDGGRLRLSYGERVTFGGRRLRLARPRKQIAET